ncbi:hypothetical protein GHK52_02640 [Lactococcus garvieae]|nr:hypothetical protein [Lactococcus garvieae]
MSEKKVELSRSIQSKEEEIQDFNRIKQGFLEVVSDFSRTAKQTQEILMENHETGTDSDDFEAKQAFENEQLFLQETVRKTQMLEADLEEESQKHLHQLQKDLDDLEGQKRKEEANVR